MSRYKPEWVLRQIVSLADVGERGSPTTQRATLVAISMLARHAIGLPEFVPAAAPGDRGPHVDAIVASLSRLFPAEAET